VGTVAVERKGFGIFGGTHQGGSIENTGFLARRHKKKQGVRVMEQTYERSG